MRVGRFTDAQKKGALHWAMEFVVVVAGVLLALWLQEWTQRQRARADMHDADAAIHDEVLGNLEDVMWRKAVSKCHLEREQLLKSMLLASTDHWPGLQADALSIRAPVPETVIPSVYSRPIEALPTSAWTAALTSGALAPMDHDRFRKLAGIYGQIEVWRRARDDESAAISELAALAFPVQLTPDLKAQMLGAVYRLDRTRFLFAFPSTFDIATTMRNIGWDDRARVDHDIRELYAQINSAGFVWRKCIQPVENPFRTVPRQAR